MGEFKEFIENRFGYSSISDSVTTSNEAVVKSKSEEEETPILDTPANRAFMARFCKKN